jgi:hypothetical protein
VTQFPSPYSAEGSDESQWRRPSGQTPSTLASSAAAPAPSEAPQPAYSGPPATVPAPPGWRPPTMITVPGPRELPAQDPEAIDRAERGALVTTYGVGMIAGAIGLLLLIVLCGRVVF